ncbi:MAG: hypothetical protein KAR38_08225, partial [Calditrichia bacterium]|nr:hypothetical protein [Calditrichia bacterium]
DINNYEDSLVYKSPDSDFLTIDVEPEGNILVIDSIVSPNGAKDSVLSSYQLFTLKTKAFFEGSLLDTGRTAEIQLPAEYTLFEGGTIKSMDNGLDSVYWQIRAPESASGPDTIRLTVNAVEANSNDDIIGNNEIIVYTWERAALTIIDSIFAPTGARNGILSTDQSFDWSITVNNENSGGASVDPLHDTTKVELTLAEGYTFNGGSTTKFIDLFIGDSSLIRVNTDAVPHNAVNISAKIVKDSAAWDENTNIPAFVAQETSSSTITTIMKAKLVVEIVDVAQDTVANNQMKPVRVRVSNIGSAEINPDSVEIQLRYSHNDFSLVGDSIRFANLNEIEQFDLTSLGNVEGLKDIVIDIIDTAVQDTNNNYPDTLVYIETKTDTLKRLIQNLGNVDIISLQFTVNENDSITVSTSQTGIQLDLVTTVHPVWYDENRTATLILPDGYGVEASL